MNKNSTNKKVSNIKRVFTFMDNDNTNNTNNNIIEQNNDLLSGNKNNANKSRNQNKDSNFDFDRKTYSIISSNINTNRNNASFLNDESFVTNYIWKFKTIEDDNKFHNKKYSGNTTMATYSYNIDTTSQNASYPIYEWLNEINLTCYYNLFIDKKIYNLDKLIYNLKNGICNILKKDIIKIGIINPGHIYRIITKLEIDSEKINTQISNFIIDKKNLSDGEINILKNSIVYCCGCCSINNQSKYYINNEFKKYQLEQWLSRIKMNKYKDNFIKNGFDMFEYFILQMFSSIPIDENILKDELKINNINDRDFILLQINKDIKYIIQKTTINNKKDDRKNFIKNNKEEKFEENTNCIVF